MTYDKRLGMVNADRRPPVVVIGGTAWCTRDGMVAVFPDYLECSSSFRPLPASVMIAMGMGQGLPVVPVVLPVGQP